MSASEGWRRRGWHWSWSWGRGRAGLLALAVVAVLMVGCASRYRITFINGDKVVVQGKPKLEHGYYIFRDAEGKEQRVNQMRIRAIEAQ